CRLSAGQLDLKLKAWAICLSKFEHTLVHQATILKFRTGLLRDLLGDHRRRRLIIPAFPLGPHIET
ncbi:hypothetical protein R2572_006686, partial [Pseudomonas aeruginosa]